MIPVCWDARDTYHNEVVVACKRADGAIGSGDERADNDGSLKGEVQESAKGQAKHARRS